MASEDKATPDIHDIQRRLAEGDRAALLTIYDRYYEELFCYGMRIVSDNQTVREGIQELFLAVWEGRNRMQNVQQIKPYLLRLLRNKLYDQLKMFPFDNLTEKEEHLSSQPYEQSLIQTEEGYAKKARIEAAFTALSPRQREMIHLRFSEGFSYEEIAEITRLSYQSIRNLVSQGLQRMRKVFSVVLQLMLFYCLV
ncbi:MAG: RNA polymerase sigma factor [Bacteroidota bacterium]